MLRQPICLNNPILGRVHHVIYPLIVRPSQTLRAVDPEQTLLSHRLLQAPAFKPGGIASLQAIQDDIATFVGSRHVEFKPGICT